MDVEQHASAPENAVAPQQRLVPVFGSRVPALWSAADRFLARAKATQPSTAPAADNIVIEPTPESRFQEVLDHVTPIFLRDEPLSHSFPACTTGRRERDFRQYATEQLRSGLSVMATDGPGGPVVGSCLNRILHREYLANSDQHQPEPDDLPEDPLVPNVVRLLTTVHRQLDLFSAFGVDEIFEIGLASVEPTHAGRGIASRMMRCSLELAAQRGLRAAKADCTGTASARAAVRAGMSVVLRLPYASYAPDGRVVFHTTGATNPELTVVAARLQPTQPYVLPAELPPPPPQLAGASPQLLDYSEIALIVFTLAPFHLSILTGARSLSQLYWRQSKEPSLLAPLVSRAYWRNCAIPKWRPSCSTFTGASSLSLLVPVKQSLLAPVVCHAYWRH